MSESKAKKKRFKPGLVPKLIMAIAAGILLGNFAPEPVNMVVVTLSAVFGSFLKFIIPLMILAFVTTGIADLTQGAGKLLGITAGISYISTLIAGSGAYFAMINLFPFFTGSAAPGLSTGPQAGIFSPYFTVELAPFIDVTGAIVLAFILGLSISAMREKCKTCVILHGFFREFSQVVNFALHKVIIPFLPLYICGTFINLSAGGAAFAILSVLWKVFLTVIALHSVYLLILFAISGSVSKMNPFAMIKNQIPGYLSAIGTQSSAATIPVNLTCAERNGVSEEIRNFVIPLCANIHMPGSMITLTSCVTAVLLMYDMPIGIGLIAPFIMTMGIVMMAAPGAPGGAIMSALPFLPLIGIVPDSAAAGLLVALYITQDSFGTACNVSGDNALSKAVDTIYYKYIKKQAANTGDGSVSSSLF